MKFSCQPSKVIVLPLMTFWIAPDQFIPEQWLAWNKDCACDRIAKDLNVMDIASRLSQVAYASLPQGEVGEFMEHSESSTVGGVFNVDHG